VSRPRPGRWLRLVAERLFDQATLERVVLPALADLQHECSERARRLVRIRAYWACTRVLVFCSLRVTASETSLTLSIVSLRTIAVLIILTGLLTLPAVASQLPRFAREADILTALAAMALLLPQALFLSLPIAYFVGLATSSQLRNGLGVTIASIGCVLVMLVIANIITPAANQGYRLLIFSVLDKTSGDGRSVTLSKGLAEMTWSELSDVVSNEPNARQSLYARVHRQLRLAISVTPLVLGLVALRLAGRWRSRLVSYAVPILLIATYWLLLAVGEKAARSPDYWPIAIWLPNVVFFLAAVSPSLGIARRASAT
jgi:lipopolysaccharide export LptBFGC system permease protein LptF